MRNQQGAARTKGEAKVTLMAAATMRACKSPYLGWLHAACNISSPRRAWNKQTAMEQQRSCHSRNTTTIDNCCEKRASLSLFTGSSQRVCDQPRGECIRLSPVCHVPSVFSTKIFLHKRLRKKIKEGALGPAFKALA